jgi:DNA-binding CsgD family transcriptional regulator
MATVENHRLHYGLAKPGNSMHQHLKFGNFSRSLISDIPANLSSEAALHYKRTLHHYAEEAVYIYSFKEDRMIYADGWEPVLGYRDDEISMLHIVNSSAPEFAPFSNELNDKALQFILGKRENLEKYHFRIELKKIHKNGTPIPIEANVGVHEVLNGKVNSIIGRFRINRDLRFGTVMRYAAYGPEKDEFEDELNKSLFTHFAISDKEKEALKYAAEGKLFKEIADLLNISVSAVEKRILPMYRRFNVSGLTHLVSFAYVNHILP